MKSKKYEWNKRNGENEAERIPEKTKPVLMVVMMVMDVVVVVTQLKKSERIFTPRRMKSTEIFFHLFSIALQSNRLLILLSVLRSDVLSLQRRVKKPASSRVNQCSRVLKRNVKDKEEKRKINARKRK